MQQSTGVGVPGLAHQGAGRPLLHNAAGIHHGNAIGHLDSSTDVVRDKNHRQTHLFLQLAKQQQDLDLHCGVERGGGLVGQQQLGPTGQGQGNHGALAHAARHFVRIGLQTALRAGNAHPLKQGQGPLLGLCLAHLFVTANGFDDLLAHAVNRVQRQQGLLKNHGRHASTEAAELVLRQREHILITDTDLSCDLGFLLGMQAQQSAQGDALARARLANQGDHFAALHAQVHARDGLNGFFAASEGDMQLADVHIGGCRRIGFHAATSEGLTMLCTAAGAPVCAAPATCIQQATCWPCWAWTSTGIFSLQMAWA